MKYLGLIFLFLISTSCCGSRNTFQDAQENLNVLTVSESESTNNEELAKVNLESETEATEEIRTRSEISEDETEAKNLNNEIEQSKEAFDHSEWNVLLKKYVSNSGNVDYKGFKNERHGLGSYIVSLGQNMPIDQWQKEDKLAYWINAYNAMTVDLIIRNYPIKSIKDIKDPWKQRLWKLGEKWYDLDEIEHQILRKMNEPRIHFGIVCASFSCPKLLNEAYTGIDLEMQLTKVTEAFLADSKRNTIHENNLVLSKIFQWFSKDFKQNGSLIEFLNQYSEVQISAKARIRYMDYNWDLNE